MSGGDWQPIETAPKDGTLLEGLRRHPNGTSFLGRVRWYVEPDPPPLAFWRWVGTGEDMGWSLENPPTHWMPIPAPPSPPKVSSQGTESV